MSQNCTRYLPDYIWTISNIFYPTVLVIGVFGNMMVITVILKMQHMRNSTNIFLANLAISDLLVLLIWGTIALVNTNLELGILAYGDGMCSIIFVMEMVPCASVLTILAIRFERYYAVCEPLKAGYVCTKSRAYRICLLVWPIAALFCSPHLFIKYRTVQYCDGTYLKTVCQEPPDSFWTNAFYATSASVFYFLPLIILTALYLIIARHLKETEVSSDNNAAIRHGRHVVKMLATVVVAFFVCHLPITVLYLLYFFTSTELIRWMGVVGYHNLWFVALLMLYLHSVVNPIVYNLMSRRFREGFNIICSDIGWCLCRGLRRDRADIETTEMSKSFDFERKTRNSRGKLDLR